MLAGIEKVSVGIFVENGSGMNYEQVFIDNADDYDTLTFPVSSVKSMDLVNDLVTEIIATTCTPLKT